MLRQSKSGETVRIGEVASRAGTSTSFVRGVLIDLSEFTDSSNLKLSPDIRFRLAFEAAKNGGLQEAARALTWQEFEKFAEECLASAAFQTTRGLILAGESRRWQIDLVARRESMILVFDCKHWNSPSYPSKFDRAAKHQKSATIAFLRSLKTKDSFGREKTWALPVILTLFDPRSQLVDDVVLVSIDKLPDFLNGITPYSQLPFISVENIAQNPIRQDITTEKNRT